MTSGQAITSMASTPAWATLGPSRVQGHYENFPVASLLCPAHLRAPIRAIYAFARIADDLADEGNAAPEARLAALSAYKDELQATLAGHAPAYAPWPALAQAIAAHQLPAAPLQALLSAFTQDVSTTRYADHGELMNYCERSANPIGRLLLHLYGVTDAQLLKESDAICTALQLINFWQDVGVDAQKNETQGRIYLPQDCLQRFGVSEKQMLEQRYDSVFAALLKYECEAARALMQSGAPLALALKGRIGWELRMVVQGGLRILEKIERVQFNVFDARPKLNAFDMIVIAYRAFWMKP
jgi:squalene synthase HpnC